MTCAGVQKAESGSPAHTDRSPSYITLIQIVLVVLLYCFTNCYEAWLELHVCMYSIFTNYVVFQIINLVTC